jgi:hypothetical protein
MATVPQFQAQVGGGPVRGPRAQETGVAQGFGQAGDTLQGIGNEIETLRDRNDLVNAQLDFEEGLIEINAQFDGDTGFEDVRERRAAAVKELKNSITENLSTRAMSEADPLFREFLLKDEIAFDAQATKTEGEHRVAMFESKRNLLMNSFIYAESDDEKKAAMTKMEVGLDSIAPFIPVDKMQSYREGFITDAKYLRQSARIPGMARAGEKFDPSKYTELEPGQVVKLQSQYNATLREMDAENRAFYSERIADHNAILMGTGDNDGLADQLEARGARDLAKTVRDNDSINRIVYDTVSAATASSVTGSIAEKYAIAREKLSYGVGDTMAAEKQKAISVLNTAAAREMASFNADPAAYVQQSSPMQEGESLAMYADRITQLQRVAAGDAYFPAKVLTKDQVNEYNTRTTLALNSGETQTVVNLLDEIRSFGPRYEHQVLTEAKAPNALHIAMDATDGDAMVISTLSALKSPKDVDPTYKELDNVDEIMNSDYVKMLTERVAYDPNPSLVDYRNSMIDLAHKWLASGRDMDDLFKMYNVADSGRGTVVLSQGLDEDDFEDKIDSYLESVDFSAYVSDANPYKADIVEKLKSDAQVANAPSSDDRLEPGQVGFYMINPMTSGVLREYPGNNIGQPGKPLLITQDEIMGFVRRSVQ